MVGLNAVGWIQCWWWPTLFLRARVSWSCHHWRREDDKRGCCRPLDVPYWRRVGGGGRL